MARVEGFEPPNHGVRIRCLTAWRYPIEVTMQVYTTNFRLSRKMQKYSASRLFRAKRRRFPQLSTLPFGARKFPHSAKYAPYWQKSAFAKFCRLYNRAMTVYAEYVIADNFSLDFFILLASSLTLKYGVKVWRLALSAIVGAACAFFSVYVHGFWLVAMKFATLAVMCVTAVGISKRLFWFCLAVLFYTFLTGGAIVGIFNLLGGEYLGGGVYKTDVPLFVYVLAVLAVGFLCYSVWTYVSAYKKIAPHLTSVKVELDKTYKISAFCDSGNTVYFNGIPVCFVVKKFGGFADYFAAQSLKGNVVSVAVTTLTGTKQTLAVPAKIQTDGDCRDVLLALPAEKCSAPYNLLLNGCFCR